mgnify:CR=1 FL=1
MKKISLVALSTKAQFQRVGVGIGTKHKVLLYGETLALVLSEIYSGQQLATPKKLYPLGLFKLKHYTSGN